MHLGAFLDGLPSQYYAWSAFSAYPRDPLRYIQVLDNVQSMTTPSVMHLLNYAAQHLEPNEVYLEVGTWRGSTMIGALLGNTAHGYAIDDDTMDEHDADEYTSESVWRKNIAAYGMSERATYINASVPAAWNLPRLTDNNPVGVYFFDGDKSTAHAAYDGLKGVVPLLGKQALIVVDDLNTTQIRQAVYVFCHEHRKAMRLHDLSTPTNNWPSWHNGIVLIGWGLDIETIVVKE